MTSDNQPSGPGYGPGYPQQNYPHHGPPQPGGNFGNAYSPIPPPKKGNTGLIIGITATVLFLVIAGVIGLFIFSNDSDDGSSSGNEKATGKNDEKPPSEVLKADDDVYSFELPSGFTAGSLSVGKAPDYNIKVVLNGGKAGEQLSVSQERTSAQDINEFEQKTQSLSQTGSDFKKIKVNDKDAISYKEDGAALSDTGGSYEYRIFMGNEKQIRVTCIYLEPAHEQDIKEGCEKVVATLKF